MCQALVFYAAPLSKPVENFTLAPFNTGIVMKGTGKLSLNMPLCHMRNWRYSSTHSLSSTMYGSDR